tara:strand:- start:240 stop:1421 length:1182 start_codon:yes stop_codon:yes gene_type:complete
MTYYILPQIEYDINPNNLKLVFDNTDMEMLINPSLKKYISKIKCLISKHLHDWSNIKKYTNPYEFIHTNIPLQNNPVSKLKPISRAFFKLIEIYNTHNIGFEKRNMKTFHLAEGPGGFLEATAYLRKNPNDLYYGMTLINKNNDTPGWKKSDELFKKYGNIIIEKGEDKTGNLYNHNNLIYCKSCYKNSMDIITADGGFDFSLDFNKQETTVFRLIFTQVAYAITMQKHNGHFILKIFDIFEKATLDIVYLLSCFYRNVIITKPNTSRSANSEKYIVCKHFKYLNTENISIKFINILKILKDMDFKKYKILSVINIPIQIYYKNIIKEINAVLGHKQIENILSTIKLITNKNKRLERLSILKSQNIQKCLVWCQKNNMPFNKNNTNSNIFLTE